jgi:hypothetical protein
VGTSYKACCLACSFALALPIYGAPRQKSDAAKTNLPTQRGGEHDFDFAIGTWITHLSRLKHPLTASSNWVDYDGSSVIRKVWDGRASIEEFEADGAGGHIEGLILCLYNPQSRQWSQSWASSADGTLGQPMVGEFKDGRGEFLDHETYDGRGIYVRWVWSNITKDSCRFEQAFSQDGGKTWEVNWIIQYTRLAQGRDKPQWQRRDADDGRKTARPIRF